MTTRCVEDADGTIRPEVYRALQVVAKHEKQTPKAHWADKLVMSVRETSAHCANLPVDMGLVLSPEGVGQMVVDMVATISRDPGSVQPLDKDDASSRV